MSLYKYRNRNLGISRAPLKSPGHQGTRLFASALSFPSVWRNNVMIVLQRKGNIVRPCPKMIFSISTLS